MTETTGKGELLSHQAIREVLHQAADSLELPPQLRHPIAVLERSERRPNWSRAAFAAVAAASLVALAAGATLPADADPGLLPRAVEPQPAGAVAVPELQGLSLRSPVDATAVLTGPFGLRFPGDMAKGGLMHHGVDFAGRPGDPIYAAADGTVVSAGWEEDLGLVVGISHGKVNGAQVTTWYAHAQELRVQVGQVVKQGDVIALMGQTGKSLGPLLHFEVRLDDEPVDPLPWLNLGRQLSTRGSYNKTLLG